MRKYYFILASAFILFINASLVGDNWKALKANEKRDLIANLQSRLLFDKLECNFEIRSYIDQTTTNVYDSESGVMYVDGKKSKTSMMGLITFRDGLHVITLNENDKTIMLSNEHKADKKFEKFWMKYITADSEIYLKNAEWGQTIKFVYPIGSEFSSTEIEITNENSLRKSVVYYSHEVALDPLDANSKRSKPRIEYVYHTFNRKPNFKEDLFDYGHIIKFENNKAILSSRYNSYELIDTRVNTKVNN